MDILVLGGTRFFGKRLVRLLMEQGHRVTVATRGLTADDFGNAVERIPVERTDPEDMAAKLGKKSWDVVYDSLAYCSNDVAGALDALECGRYVMTSSSSVYRWRPGLREEDFDPFATELFWCEREDVDYGMGKRQAECALFQKYSHVNAAAVRLPFVIGPDDYTRRIEFYVNHTLEEKPMLVDNINESLAFIDAGETAKFLGFLGESNVCGPVNGCSDGTASVGGMLNYVKLKSGKLPVLLPGGEAAPYNGAASFSLENRKAKAAGFSFHKLDEHLYPLLDFYMDKHNK